jgi:hypothetical protein
MKMKLLGILGLGLFLGGAVKAYAQIVPDDDCGWNGYRCVLIDIRSQMEANRLRDLEFQNSGDSELRLSRFSDPELRCYLTEDPAACLKELDETMNKNLECRGGDQNGDGVEDEDDTQARIECEEKKAAEEAAHTIPTDGDATYTPPMSGNIAPTEAEGEAQE